ncbi:MAG TPA: NAD(P)-dependent oxidoreductase [Candidatus Bathyarchaeia archaeon]|nr:NAD(P)-dependent oxidoreductase [Candidatus Bathyarchaeia archaeon]
MKKAKIAVFGATSHIAKGLINNFLEREEFSLHLYTRSPDKACRFLGTIKKSPDKNCVIHEGYENFIKSSYDIIINCVGVGPIDKLQGNYTNYFMVTEKYDNLVIECLRSSCPEALYISFSSGAIYGSGFTMPAEENTMSSIRVNHVAKEDYYSISRLNSEVKHRAFDYLRIVDLRVFSYFSRFIDLTDSYFITELLDCVLKKKVFVTTDKDFVRDYLHPKDMYSAIKGCMKFKKINAAFDINSARPVEKKEILDYFSSEYGLKYQVSRALKHVSATGSKDIYYSKYNKAREIGYKPVFTSMETIKEESKYILTA